MHTVLELIASVVKSTVHADKPREFWAVAGSVSAAGSFIAGLLGGWDAGLKVLLIFMLMDFILGFTLACLGRSKKSHSGGLNSTSAWAGLTKKIGSLFVVAIASLLDGLMGTTFLRDAAVLFYIAGELISLTENTALLGVPWPPAVLKAIDVLKNQADKSDKPPGE